MKRYAAVACVLVAVIMAPMWAVSVTAEGQARPLPDLAEYAVFRVAVIDSCPDVSRVSYERADGSDREDPYFSLWTFNLEGAPFLYVEIDSKTGELTWFWFDADRDGAAEEQGDWEWFERRFPSKNICVIAQSVR